jgi:Type IV secretion system pilin
LVVYVQDVVKYLLGFITIIAIVYVIYAGFQLMIGAGDEEKSKKAKNTILYVIVGIVIMWLAYTIVNIVMTTLKRTTNTNTPTDIIAQVSDWIIPQTHAAAYSESTADTFVEYQNKLRVAIQNLESELRVNGKVEISNIQNIKSLLQGAYDRLPDNGTLATENDTAKRAVDMYLDQAIKNPNSINYVPTAISKVAAFIDGAKIESIS